MTIRPRTRRRIASAVAASALCTSALSTPAVAAMFTGTDGDGQPDAVHRMPAHHLTSATRGTSGSTALAEPSQILSAASGSTMRWPTRGRLTSTYGPRGGRLHRGIDVAAPIGTPIRAVADGTVRSAGWQGGYGYTVEIAHGDDLVSLSAHQSELTVRRGQRVRRGQVIGRVGSTGSSTGPHLHFELVVRGAPLDPLTVLPRRV